MTVFSGSFYSVGLSCLSCPRHQSGAIREAAIHPFVCLSHHIAQKQCLCDLRRHCCDLTVLAALSSLYDRFRPFVTATFHGVPSSVSYHQFDYFVLISVAGQLCHLPQGFVVSSIFMSK